MLIVLTLTAIFAGAAMISLRVPFQAARLENTLERVALTDRQMRDYARRYARPVRILIHLDAKTITGIQLPSGKATFPRFQVGGGVCMDQLILAGRRIDCGEVAIAVSSRGRTPTYAIRFRDPKGGRLWLMFLGVTGQNIRIDDEREIEALLRLSGTLRTDAG